MAKHKRRKMNMTDGQKVVLGIVLAGAVVGGGYAVMHYRKPAYTYWAEGNDQVGWAAWIMNKKTGEDENLTNADGSMAMYASSNAALKAAKDYIKSLKGRGIKDADPVRIDTGTLPAPPVPVPQPLPQPTASSYYPTSPMMRPRYY